ncbi:MAG: HlyD family type I secretion periplasmic adaptor subunit [Hyphomicrobiaceae bacterium]|nr:HlyD family type I secretion periplasmic adaptor subunit [Hyphomicrobiaceae bacterium]
MKLAKLFDVAPRSDSTEPWHSTTPWVRLGMRVCIGLVIGVVVFGVLVSINGAVVATGTVTVEHNYKVIQHLDGGVIGKIFVRNGQRVAAGQTLIALDDTADKANLVIIRSRITEGQIQLARLEAERDSKPAFVLPPALAAQARQPAIAAILETQRALFNARHQSRTGEQSVLKQRIEQLSAQLAGLTPQLQARRRELDIARQDLTAVRGLFKKGYANRQRLTTLERDVARLEGEVGRLVGEVVRTEGGLAEARLTRAQNDKTFTEKVVDELQKTKAALRELEENRVKLEQKLDRATIRAPVAGLVHALQIHTVGGVVQPAKPIVTIIPDGEQLVVEAQVRPDQIDKVKQGSTAGIRFPAFNARTTPRLHGTVTIVSPAQIMGEQGKAYFTAMIEIPASELRKINARHRLLPGMPAEVYIETGSRSMLSYILKPLIDAMMPAFRES